MRRIICSLFGILFLSFYLWSPIASANNAPGIPILVYHNFDPVKKGMMTLSTRKFEEQMKWLKDNGYTVIPLQQAVSYLEGKIASVPAKSVVITDDDGRKAVLTYMWPIIKKYNYPVTLFIYPQVISRAPYALTWDQLKELQNTGLFNIQSHTYWHPNFKQEKRHNSQSAYDKIIHAQLVTSKEVLEKKLGTKITLLAWPFGIYDNYLKQKAKEAGYRMAFSIDAHDAERSDNKMAVARYMIVEGQTMKTFKAIVQGHAQSKRHLKAQKSSV